MNDYQVDLLSSRARQARLAARIGQKGYVLLASVAAASLSAGLLLLLLGQQRPAFACLSIGLLLFMPAIWYRQELRPLPVTGNSLSDRLSPDVLQRLAPGQELAPVLVWKALATHWQSTFLLNHLLLHPDSLEQFFSPQTADMAAVWQRAVQLADAERSQVVEPGHVMTAIMLTSPEFVNYLQHIKLSARDVEIVLDWLERLLEAMRAEKPYFGGIGRDWANGFTPNLNQYGTNISLAIEQHGAHFAALTESPGVLAVRNAFSQGASTVALIGETGIGKTSHVNALAQLLLEEKNDRNLEHRQIVSLSPSTILAAAKGPGELEQIVMMLLVETVHAGHIILFLDDAQLFFQEGHGSFDMTRILLPVVQSRSVQMVLAMTGQDYQRLKVSNPAFASLLTPVVLSEPPEYDVVRILQDRALVLEHKHKLLITYEALQEAYRLAGRYIQDLAFPGKAIQVLEQSLSYAEHGNIITAGSIQTYIEQSRGVKVSSAAPAEADSLLNLEDKIHERMINQSQAVKVVAGALRRARAGVSSPKRPIGSFLFLGPTGVGKTELAKAVAATYFNAEENMIRLDMSEYQRPEDVARLLSDGTAESGSLIMSIRRSPFSVVLLDEIEKAHPNILNLLLQLLDEGQLTDIAGRTASFRDAVIIATSNAGANTVRERIGRGEPLESFQNELFDELIASGQYRPELLNRFDEIVIFRPLNQEELAQVVRLMLQGINQTLASQHISVELTDSAVYRVVEAGYDARLGARPMRRALQRAVENGIANRILRGETRPGDHVLLDAADLEL